MTYAAPLPEESLVALLKTGSREGFNYLYKNYSGGLYGTIMKVVGDEGTAQDVLQDAFVKIWNNIGQYDAAKGRIYTWMLNICRNAAIDKLRSRGEIMKSKIQTGEQFVSNVLEGRKTEQYTDAIGLKSMVAGLRQEYAAIVDLAYYQGYTLDEISKKLDVPLGTVKTRMRAAMMQLRQLMSK